MAHVPAMIRTQLVTGKPTGIVGECVMISSDSELSVINRLEEIALGGRRRQYRSGGLGLENVFTAEVVMSVDSLPVAI